MAEDLKQWYLFYRKNRDLMLRKIDKVKEEEDSIIIINKDNSQEICAIEESPTSYLETLKKHKKDTKINIIVLNKKSNIDLLVKEWEKIVEYTFLTVMFVNPNSFKDNKWILKPSIHHRITEKSVLKTGIYSLAENVDLC